MSEIKAGDLVKVVRELDCRCDHPDPYLGHIFVVAETEFDESHCPDCGTHFRFGMLATYAGSDNWFFTHRLKRIPPLEELDDVKRDETIEA